MALTEKTMFATRTINAPIEEVFARISDHEKFLSTLPFSSTTIQQPGREEKNGLGAIRLVSAPGLSLEEEITAFDPPHSFEYLIINNPRQPQHKFARVSFYTVSGGTRVDWESRLSIDVPIIGALIGTAVQQSFSQIFSKLLKNLSDDYP